MSSSSNASTSGSSPVATFFNTIWGVVVNPMETMSDIDERRPVVQGLIVIIAVGLIGGFARYITIWETNSRSLSASASKLP